MTGKDESSFQINPYNNFQELRRTKRDFQEFQITPQVKDENFEALKRNENEGLQIRTKDIVYTNQVTKPQS